VCYVFFADEYAVLGRFWFLPPRRRFPPPLVFPLLARCRRLVSEYAFRSASAWTGFGRMTASNLALTGCLLGRHRVSAADRSTDADCAVIDVRFRYVFYLPCPRNGLYRLVNLNFIVFIEASCSVPWLVVRAPARITVFVFFPLLFLEVTGRGSEQQASFCFWSRTLPWPEAYRT